MIEKFDYLEPACALCGGKDFYYPQKDAPLGRIPVDRIIRKADSLFDKNDYKEAGKLLDYWKAEAVALKDKQGELAIHSELIGYCRKQNDVEKGLASITRALALVEELEQGHLACGATVFINCATAYHAFGNAQAAMPLYERAEDIYTNALSADDTRFGGLYNNMALTLAALGRFREAEIACFSALSVMELTEGTEAECAITHINLAYLYAGTGKQEKISACLQTAYSLLKSEHLPHDGHYAFVLEKCAPAFADFGDAQTCAQLKKESEEIYART